MIKIKVKGISFLGVRTNKAKSMKNLYLNVLGLTLVSEQPEFISLRASNGDSIELYGSRFPNNKYFTNPVCGFEVSDIFKAREALKRNKLKLLTEVMGRPGGTRWVHFVAPDGNVYEITHHAKKR